MEIMSRLCPHTSSTKQINEKINYYMLDKNTKMFRLVNREYICTIIHSGISKPRISNFYLKVCFNQQEMMPIALIRFLVSAEH